MKRAELIFKGAVLLLFLVMAALNLSGCVTTHDQVGNTYPEVCLGEMRCVANLCTLGGKTVQVQETSIQKMPIDKKGKPFLGWYDYGSGMAQVLDTQTGSRLEDTKRHEVCHAIAGRWHPE